MSLNEDMAGIRAKLLKVHDYVGELISAIDLFSSKEEEDAT